jgi:urease gamma subunit
MIEFDTNVLAFMTAALEQICKKLKEDTPEARKYVAGKLIKCAKSGKKSMAHLIEAGEQALAELM